MLANNTRQEVTKRPWMNSKKMILVTKETLSDVIDECIKAELYAIDLETTGLDKRVFDGRTVDRIVGVCLSPDGVTGYYLPLRHVGEGSEACLPITLAENELRRLCDSNAVAIFHNAKFDQEFLTYNGGAPIGNWETRNTRWHDTLALAFLDDCSRKQQGLKFLSKEFLECEMIELPELFPEKERKKGDFNFSKLDPTWEPVLWYACSDAICTYNLYKYFSPE